MTISPSRRLLVAWGALVAITVIYLWIDHSATADGTYVASATVTVSAIVLALVKFRIVMREFMDMREGPVLAQRICDAVVAVIAVALLGTYAIGTALA